MQVLLRVALLVGLLSFAVLFIFARSSYFLGAFLFFGAILTIISIFNLVNRTNRYLANFLMSIKYDDFEAHYSRNTEEKAERELFGAFNLISRKFQDIRLEKEIQFQYFQTLVEKVETGLIGFDKDGKTIFMNKALQFALRKSYFPSFSSIKKYDESLYDTLITMKSGERKLVKKIIDQETVQLSVQKTLLKVKNNEYTIFSVQNIHAELQAQEIVSWQKLIRTLTHEIMNSVSPIVSLAHSTNDLISNEETLDDEMKEDIRMAIEAIKKRSQGLLHFTQTYRKLTKIPPPKLTPIIAQDLLEGILLLMGPILKKKEIRLIKNFTDNAITFQGDSDQLEQVFINLIKNAMEAIEDPQNRVITISIEDQSPRVVFRVRDSGKGIPPELREQIFVPFFTTKQEGTGIGLSLTRQIVYQHGGSITVYSPGEGGTEFVVTI